MHRGLAVSRVRTSIQDSQSIGRIPIVTLHVGDQMSVVTHVRELGGKMLTGNDP
jgi:hypothetical protein